MFKNEYTNRQVAQIVKRANHIPLVDVWTELVDEVLVAECQKSGTCKEFILCPLMSAVSLYLASSSVQAFPETPDGICMYTALASFPSTGKTNAMNKVKSSFEKVEHFLNVQDNDSQIINAPTVEGLFDLLARLKHVIGFFDEGGLFFGALGRYGSGGDKSGYDRSVYLNLWNALATIERDLKTEGRSKLHGVRLMLALLTHPKTIINLIKIDDGFSHRFNTCSPAPADITAEDIRSACTRRSIIPLPALFLFIRLLHAYPRLYTLSPEAEKLFDSTFNRFKRFVKYANYFDSFLGGVFGKCATHIIRNCLIIKALIEACNTLKDMTNLDELTEDLKFKFEETIRCMPATSFIIDVQVVQYAINLNSFFLMNKLVMGTYEVEATNDVFGEVESLLARENEQPEIKGEFVCVAPNLLDIMEKIIFAKATMKPFPSDCGSHNFKSHEIEEGMKKLQHYGIGTVVPEKANNNRWSNRYFKPTPQELIDNPSIARKLQNMGCDLEKYNQLCLEIQEKEKQGDQKEKKTTKRKTRSIDQCSQAKRPKNEAIIHKKVIDSTTQLPRLVACSPISQKVLKRGSSYLYNHQSSSKTNFEKHDPGKKIDYNVSDNDQDRSIVENESDNETDSYLNNSTVESKKLPKSHMKNHNSKEYAETSVKAKQSISKKDSVKAAHSRNYNHANQHFTESDNDSFINNSTVQSKNKPKKNLNKSADDENGSQIFSNYEQALFNYNERNETLTEDDDIDNNNHDEEEFHSNTNSSDEQNNKKYEQNFVKKQQKLKNNISKRQMQATNNSTKSQTQSNQCYNEKSIKSNKASTSKHMNNATPMSDTFNSQFDTPEIINEDLSVNGNGSKRKISNNKTNLNIMTARSTPPRKAKMNAKENLQEQKRNYSRNKQQ